MDPKNFEELATAQIADACVRLSIHMIVAPPGLRPIHANAKIAGPVRPVRHYGSIDTLFEALEHLDHGDIVVFDNDGRTDEACIGDLAAIETQDAGAAGMIIWGLHRDTPELEAIGLPVFSYGVYPVGPRRADAPEPEALTSARIGNATVTADHTVFADQEGAIFISSTEVDVVLASAQSIRQTEEAQAALVAQGQNLREQLRFNSYLAKRRCDPTYSLRDHLIDIGGAIEA